MIKRNLKAIAFLGTGPSSGVPNLFCLSTSRCRNCLNPKNTRTCVSVLLETEDLPILIDCGKDFKNQYNNYLLKSNFDTKTKPIIDAKVTLGIEINAENNNNNKFASNKKHGDPQNTFYNEENNKEIDLTRNEERQYRLNMKNNNSRINCMESHITQFDNSCTKNNKDENIKETKDLTNQASNVPFVLLTHPHADAILGLDSLKQMIPNQFVCNLYADKRTLEHLKLCFAYLFLVDQHNKLSSGAIVGNEIKKQEKVVISNIDIIPFYVDHGHEECLAFFIDNLVLYVSDCSKFRIPSNIYNVEILIIECTTIDRFAYGHINLLDVLDVIKELKPRKTYLVGMSHWIDYEELCSMVGDLEDDITVAFDGMKISFRD